MRCVHIHGVERLCRDNICVFFHSLAQCFFGFDHIGERSTHFLPTPRFESTVGVYPQHVGGQVSRGLLHQLDDLFLCWNIGRMDVVDTRANLIGIGEFLKTSSSAMFDLDVSMVITSASMSAIDSMMSLNAE